MSESSQEKLTARQNRMEMANEGVRALVTINGAGAEAMLALLQFILQASIGPKLAAIVALLCFATGMFLAAIINFVRVESSLAKTGSARRNILFWFHRAMAMISALSFLIGSVAIAAGYACA